MNMNISSIGSIFVELRLTYTIKLSCIMNTLLNYGILNLNSSIGKYVSIKKIIHNLFVKETS